MLVWTGEAASSPALQQWRHASPAPLAYTPPYLAEKILTSRSALEGERKQVTVLFADLKDSTELIRGLDPEAAQQLLDPALQRMMDAVHRFEGTVNQVLGDGIMALFGAPIAHEDHALRACYAALAMQAAHAPLYRGGASHPGLGAAHARGSQRGGSGGARHWQRPAHGLLGGRGDHGPGGAHGTDWPRRGPSGSRAATLRLVEGLVQVTALGPVPVKGLVEPVEVFELVGRQQPAPTLAGGSRAGPDAALWGGSRSWRRCTRPWHGRRRARARWSPWWGKRAWASPAWSMSVSHSHRTQGWRVLESASVSYGKATPYLPVIDLLKRYCHVEDAR